MPCGSRGLPLRFKFAGGGGLTPTLKSPTENGAAEAGYEGIPLGIRFKKIGCEEGESGLSSKVPNCCGSEKKKGMTNKNYLKGEERTQYRYRESISR